MSVGRWMLVICVYFKRRNPQLKLIYYPAQAQSIMSNLKSRNYIALIFAKIIFYKIVKGFFIAIELYNIRIWKLYAKVLVLNWKSLGKEIKTEYFAKGN